MSSHSVWIGLLGPVRVLRDGNAIELTGRRQRSLLAMLALHEGKPVSAGTLFNAIWGEADRADPDNVVQSRVSALRKLIGNDALRSRTASGYALDTSVVRTDVAEARALFDAAKREEDPHAAQELYEQGLGLWRGSPLLDVAIGGQEAQHLAELELLQLSSTTELIELEIARGDTASAQGRLLAMTAQHPLDERLWALLIYNEFATGRQAHALQHYQTLAESLRSELGVSPRAQLAELHRRILDGDEPGARDVVLGSAGAPPVEAPLVSEQIGSSASTHLFGREGEAGFGAKALLEHRLLTVLGPGGIGKTSLAHEIVDRVRCGFSDGVVVFELDSFVPGKGGHNILHQMISAVLREEEITWNSPMDPADVLRSRNALLLVDNCEHLVEELAPAVEQFLAQAPQCRVLATSREPLGLRAEQRLRLGPLELPGPQAHDRASVLATPAAELVLARARQADPHFELADDDVPHLVALTRGLAGIPLALELAASQVTAFSLEEIVRHIGELDMDSRSGSTRHRTMKATIEWSYELLSDQEKAVFEAAAVFSGGATVDALMEVAPCFDVLRCVRSLVEKSLLVSERAKGSAPARITMLDPIRRFAINRRPETLAERRERHLQWAVRLCAQWGPMTRAPGQGKALRALDVEQDNLVTAIRHAQETGRTTLALRLCCDIAWFWRISGRQSSGAGMLDDAIVRVEAAGADPEAALLAEAHGWACHLFQTRASHRAVEHGLIAVRMSAELGPEYAQRRAVCESFLARAYLLNGERERAVALTDAIIGNIPVEATDWRRGVYFLIAGMAQTTSGAYGKARPLYLTAIEHYQRAGDSWGAQRVLARLATISRSQGRIAEAAAMHERCVDLLSEHPYGSVELALRQSLLAEILVELGEPERGLALLQPLLANGTPTARAWAGLGMSVYYGSRGRWDLARAQLEPAYETFRRHSGYLEMATAAGRLSLCARALGERDDAIRHQLRSLRGAMDCQEAHMTTYALLSTADLLLREGDKQHAEQAVVMASAMRKRSALVVPYPYELVVLPELQQTYFEAFAKEERAIEHVAGLRACAEELANALASLVAVPDLVFARPFEQ